MISSKLIEVLKNDQIYYLGDGTKLVSVMPVKNLSALIAILIERGALNQSLHTPSFHIPLNSFVKEYSSLTNLPFHIRKGSILLYRNKLPNMMKILLFYSGRGAHFQDSKIRLLIPEYKDVTSWESAIYDGINS